MKNANFLTQLDQNKIWDRLILKSFKLYLTANLLQKIEQKVFSLHLAEEQVPDIWFTLPESQKKGNGNVYNNISVVQQISSLKKIYFCKVTF